MQSISSSDCGEVNSLAKSPQLDVLLAGYATQRADCSAIYGASTNMLGFIVGTMGFVAVFVGNSSRVPSIWLALVAVLPWGMLSYHSLMVGMNAGHSYVCEVYERLIAEVAPKGLIYHEKEKKEKIILGVTVGERFLDPKRASISRSAASIFAFIASVGVPLVYFVYRIFLEQQVVLYNNVSLSHIVQFLLIHFLLLYLYLHNEDFLLLA